MADRKGDESATDESRDASRAEDAEASPRRTPIEVVLSGLAMFVACRVLYLVLQAQSTAAAVAQAIVVEWGCSRIGVSWSAEGETVTAGRLARRAGVGVLVGVLLGAAVFGILAVSGGATFSVVPRLEASVFALGAIGAALAAWRDELLFHGVTLRALTTRSSSEGTGPVGRILACAATSAGAALGRSDATAASVIAALLLGAVAGALWVRDGGAWQPWAATTTFQFVTGTLLSGGLLQSRVATGAWAGSSGLAGGQAAVVALAPFAVLALGLTWRTSRTRSQPPGGVG
jgi:hypothetical protein